MPGPVTTLSVILPCHNEAENVLLWERDLFPVLRRLPFSVEVVVVDDGSTDGTAAEVVRLGARVPALRMVRHEKNLGLGRALCTGFEAAAGDAILTLDADLTFPPEAIPALISALSPDVDCVCASPFRGGFDRVPVLRRVMAGALNGIYRVLLGRPLTAVSSICRLYRTDVLRRLEFKCASFDINAEIMFNLVRSGAQIREIAAVLGVRRHGRSKINVAREVVNHARLFLRVLAWRVRAA